MHRTGSSFNYKTEAYLWVVPTTYHSGFKVDRLRKKHTGIARSTSTSSCITSWRILLFSRCLILHHQSHFCPLDSVLQCFNCSHIVPIEFLWAGQPRIHVFTHWNCSDIGCRSRVTPGIIVAPCCNWIWLIFGCSLIGTGVFSHW